MSTNTLISTKSGQGVGEPPSSLWPGRSHISSFIRCLHLLDLDLRDDWPGITVQTLSTRTTTQNLQQRVKAVEWGLFRLLELYDLQLARDVGPSPCYVVFLLMPARNSVHSFRHNPSSS